LGASRFDHSHSQQPVPRDFPLFKRCESIGRWSNRPYPSVVSFGRKTVV